MKRSSAPEVLLLETQLLTAVKAIAISVYCLSWLVRRDLLIIRVQHSRDGFGSHLVMYRLLILARVELLEVKLAAGSFAGPQTQVVGGRSIVTRNRHVVGVGSHYLAVLPNRDLSSVVIVVLANVTVKLDVDGNIVSRELPGIEVEPVIGNLNLVSVDNLLLEDTISVSQTIAPGRVVERGETVQKAGC